MRLNDTFKRVALFSSVLFQATLSFAQLWTNPITGANPATNNPYTSGDVYFDGAVLVSGIGRGAGIDASAADNSYQASGWNSPSFDPADYFSFTMEKDPANQWGFTVSDFTFTGTASAGGPVFFSVRSSLDDFTSDLGPVTSNGGTITLNGLHITGAVTFRIYGWGASSVSGTFGINDFNFSGGVPLSLIFENFRARSVDKDVALSWKLAGELTEETISILHCMDGRNFTLLKEMGRSQTSFLHEKPMNGTHYYRLQWTSLDGNASYSKTVSVSVGNDNKILLYPNPARNQLCISTAANGTTVRSLTIYNALGAAVSSFGNLKNNAVDIGTLSNGVYTAEAILTDGTLTKQTFIVKK